MVKAYRAPPILGRFLAAILVPRKAHRDLDNFIKPTLDMLQAVGTIENDRLADLVLIGWSENPAGGMAVCLRTIGEPADDQADVVGAEYLRGYPGLRSAGLARP
jgi:hypothetical protein